MLYHNGSASTVVFCFEFDNVTVSKLNLDEVSPYQPSLLQVLLPYPMQWGGVVLCSQQPNYSSLHPETLLTFFLFFCVPSWFSLGAYLRLMALTLNTVQKQKLNHQ